MRPLPFILGGIVALVLAVVVFRAPSRDAAESAQTVSTGKPGSERRSGPDAGSGDGKEEDAADGPGRPAKSSDRAVESAANLEARISRLEKQQQELSSRKDRERIVYAAELPISGNPVGPLYQLYLEGERTMIQMQEVQGLGKGHPQRVAQGKVMEAMAGDLDEAIAKLSEQMQAELDASRKALGRVKGQR